MIQTGIVRRIDELGRVVIPKEIRRTMRLREGEAMEIYTEGDSLILKKYSSIKNLSELSQEYADCMSRTSGETVLITDTEAVVAASNKKIIGEPLSRRMLDIMNGRKLTILECDKVICIGKLQGGYQVIAPIISEGCLIGGIITVASVSANVPIILKLSECAADFLSKQVS